MQESPRYILASGAAAMGVALDERQLDRFEAFTSLLLEWNRKLNLTRITDPIEIAVKHYLDSLSLFSVVDMPADACVIDVGTGAGLPGIALKIALPRLRVTLLDSVRKRLLFVQAAATELHIEGVSIVHARAEDAGRMKAHRERFDFAVSRAVARLNVLAELCMPFCHRGGRFIAYKGPDADAEVAEAAHAIRELGGEADAVHRLTLPHSDQQRSLVVVRKTRRTPQRYPRKAGEPDRSPI